jgi:hypothetical protein
VSKFEQESVRLPLHKRFVLGLGATMLGGTLAACGPTASAEQPKIVTPAISPVVDPYYGYTPILPGEATVQVRETPSTLRIPTDPEGSSSDFSMYALAAVAGTVIGGGAWYVRYGLRRPQVLEEAPPRESVVLSTDEVQKFEVISQNYYPSE